MINVNSVLYKGDYIYNVEYELMYKIEMLYVFRSIYTCIHHLRAINLQAYICDCHIQFKLPIYLHINIYLCQY